MHAAIGSLWRWRHASEYPYDRKSSAPVTQQATSPADEHEPQRERMLGLEDVRRQFERNLTDGAFRAFRAARVRAGSNTVQRAARSHGLF